MQEPSGYIAALIGPGGDPHRLEPAEGLLRSLCPAWSRIKRTDRWDASDGAGAVIVDWPDSASRPDRVRLADKLREAYVPGVFFAQDPAQRAELAGQGVVALDTDAGPAVLAGALAGLLAQQGTVRGLRRDLRVAQTSQSGVQIEIERMHDELNLAAQIQRETLPRAMPQVRGLDFGVVFMPAGYVSGDIYDVQTIDESRASFFLADAVGHGVPAALLTMIIARSLTQAGMGRSVEPADAMTRLNDELVRAQRGRVRFATAVCGLVDAAAGEVTLTCAGHPPPLIVGDGTMERVPIDGPLLGVFPGERFEQRRFALPPGRTLLLYSDGFETAFPDPDAPEESMRRGNREYLGRLASLPWPKAGDDSLQRTITLLTDSIVRHAGSLHQVDDVTALAITNTGLASSQTHRPAA